eukprot:CAMPEP_0171125038 /NCGR_PEP_ID=MMETSP0766_2-20121228/110439_1 /TAXON_ID=439317 /ORGANISM="Gambierdiscus australes, Strain CAWD 149" /LENGTH=387 /DNA_ID=CAMNT_0011588003 /DNA_START=1 /DNA_END=1164 /DNA_ORIENTATION=+
MGCEDFKAMTAMPHQVRSPRCEEQARGTAQGKATLARSPRSPDASGDVAAAPDACLNHTKPTTAFRRRRRRKAAQMMRARADAPATGHEEERLRRLRKSGRHRSGKACASESHNLAELAQGLEAGGSTLESTLLLLRGRMVALSFNAEGCRVVQRALEVAQCRAIAQHITELHGHVLEAIKSPNANYVLQKIIEVMPLPQGRFIVEELSGAGVTVACHRFGCRILCRLVEHAVTDNASVELIDEVLGEAAALCCNAFGHYVIQAILEHGLPLQRERICAALCGDVLKYARSRHACYVLEDALFYCSATDRQAIVDGLLACPLDDLAVAAQESPGCSVVRALLRLPGEASQQARERLAAVAKTIHATKYGRRVLEDLGLGEAVPEGRQ